MKATDSAFEKSWGESAVAAETGVTWILGRSLFAPSAVGTANDPLAVVVLFFDTNFLPYHLQSYRLKNTAFNASYGY